MGRKSPRMVVARSNYGNLPGLVHLDERVRISLVGIMTLTGDQLRDPDWSTLEAILTSHARRRVVTQQPGSLASARKRLRRIQAASDVLVGVLTSRGGSELDEAAGRPLADIWDLLEENIDRILPFELLPKGERGAYERSIDDVVDVLRNLSRTAESLSGTIPIHHIAEDALGRDPVFEALASRLATWWESATGRLATIRKDSDKQKGRFFQASPFVSFVETALASLPDEARPRRKTPAALSQQLTLALHHRLPRNRDKLLD
jgi:hypothetical protein